MLPRPSGFMAGLQYDISARQKKLEKKLYPYGPPYLAEYGGDLPAEVCWGWDLLLPHHNTTLLEFYDNNRFLRPILTYCPTSATKRIHP